MPQNYPIDLGMIIFVAIYLLIGLAILFSVTLIILRVLQRRNKLPKSLNLVTLLVLVPKEFKEEAPEAKKEEKEIISVAEQMLANLSAITVTDRSLVRKLIFGKANLGFELVADEGQISFYVVTPRRLKGYIEKQIHSQYPKAEVLEAGEYNIFRPQCEIEGKILTLDKPSYFPFKTYQELETDPLNAVANALSKFDENEGAAIQILFRPAPKNWSEKGAEIAKKMQQGKSFKQAAEQSSSISSLISDIVTPKPREEKKEKEDIIRLSPIQEETIKKLEGKGNKLGFEVNLRVIVSSSSASQAKNRLSEILGAFTQYTSPSFNKLTAKTVKSSKLINDFIFRYFDEKNKIVLNTEEIASLFHFPTKFTETPNIKWLPAKKAAPPPNMPREGLLLGSNVYRGVEVLVKIKPDDRRRHMYIIGRTGTGKSVFLQNMAIQDIRENRGLCVVDPHGDLIEGILPFIPKERAEDVILFNPSDIERPMGLNMLEYKTEDQKDFAIQEMISIFYKLFPPEMIGPMFEHNMRNVMLTLMADKENLGTIAEIPRMFTDTEYQQYKLIKVTDPVVRAFWEKEMAKTSDFHKSEMLGYLISKVGRFVENEMMRNIIGQSKSGFDIREVMDSGKILLVNLCKGKVGEVNSSLLGLIIVSKIQMASMTRADIPEEQRKDFYLYVDEFQNFATDSFASILAEARKYRLNLIVAHQYITQLEEKIRDAVFGNVGTFISFRIGVEDAEIIAKEFEPVFNQNDLINIERYNAYLKLMINGTASRAFNMTTFPPPSGADVNIAESIKEISRLKYARAKDTVEREILERSKLGSAESIQKMTGEKSL